VYFTLSVLDILWIYGDHKIQFVKIIAGCGGQYNTLGLLCRRPGFTSEFYGHLNDE